METLFSICHVRSGTMMDTIRAAGAALLLGLVPLATGGATPAAASEAINLVYASGWPKEHVQVGVVADEWIKRIEEATEGRVRMRHVPGGALLKPEAILEGVRKGVADCGPLVTSYAPGALPISSTLMSSVDIELGNKLDVKGITAISARLFDEFPEFTGEYSKLGLKGMLWVPTAPYAIISKKPTTTLADLEGQKLRGFGKTVPQFEAAMGAVPVALAFGEMYTSIQTGVIDGAMTDPPAMMVSRLYEVAKYVIKTGPQMGTALTGASVIYICNQSSWAKINEADRKRIDAVAMGMAGYISEIMLSTSEKALEDLKAKGVTVSNLSQQEIETLEKKISLFEDAGAELEKQGLPGNAMVARYRVLAADYLSGKWKP
jgi:TRAP-type C4-dicarboxylate transport system substrate-binding protein